MGCGLQQVISHPLRTPLSVIQLSKLNAIISEIYVLNTCNSNRIIYFNTIEIKIITELYNRIIDL
jgi:hypothetical protein